VAKGKVVVSDYDQYSGNKIAIRHADNSTSYYMHLSSRGVGVGAQVTGGQVIGRVGSTGRSTGPHLHLGFKNAQGQWINPRSKTMIATPKLQGERMARLTQQIVGIRESLRELEEVEPVQIEGSTVKVKQKVLSRS
jgi:murein DD-endopeptidase MepM/ murein hydrolase activator NlpD